MLSGRTRSITTFRLYLFLLIIAIYLLCASGKPWVESTLQLNVARNLIRNHAISWGYRTSHIDIQGRNGRWYNPDGLTNVFSLMPFAVTESLIHAITHNYPEEFMSFLAALTSIVINALVCTIFFSLLILFGRPLRISYYAALSLAFLTIVFPYASLNYEENLNMLFILSSLYFLFKFKETYSINHIVYCGGFAGLAILTRDASWIFLFCLGLYMVYSAWKKQLLRIFAIFVITLIPFFVVWASYNLPRTGYFYLSPIMAEILHKNQSPISMENIDKFTPGFSILAGLYGLLLSGGGSIFVYSPLLVLALFGWKKFFIARREESILILSIIIMFITAHAAMKEWFGFWGWGPRYMLSIMPLMMLPYGFWLSVEGLKNKFKRYIVYGFSGYSLLIQLGGTLTNWHGRFGHLFQIKNEILFSAQKSQWWDSLKTLFINFWNMLFGSFRYFENPGYNSGMSEINLGTSQTLYTWWNRLIIMGINPVYIAIYLLFSFIIIYYLWREIKQF